MPVNPNVAAAASPLDLARSNVAAIVGAVLDRGPLPRARIADTTGLSAAAVTRLTARLIAAGLIRELPAVLGPHDSGRPRIPLDLDTEDRLAVGIHIGLLRTEIGLVDLRGEVFARSVLTHRSTEPGAVVRQAAVGAESLLEREGLGRTVLGYGVGVGGWVDSESGVVVEHASLGWSEVPLRALLAERFAQPVLLDSAVRGTARAECLFGAAAGAASIVELFIGNVVDAAVVIDRKVHRGPRGGAGRLTHLPIQGARGAVCVCGRRDCAQAVISDAAILGLARERGLAGPKDELGDLVARSGAGDRGAAEVLRERGRRVGQVAALLLDIVNPELVVVAGGPLATAEHLASAQRELVHRHRAEQDTARLVPSALGEHSLVIACATVFLDAYYADPLSYEGERLRAGIGG